MYIEATVCDTCWTIASVWNDNH